jgi:RecA/RadA recombinase
MKSFKEPDTVSRLAESFVNQTGCNVFLTGKAGSGKTTFLHHIIKNTPKKFVVAAPTGVSAINAGGMTIHSFFQLPIGFFIPERWTSGIQNFSQAVYTQDALLKKIRINKQKRKLIQELELLVIDEVSMVRADVMDAIDTVLKSIRRNYNQPFGGVQMLLIGDMNQLPPVVPEQEKQLLYSYYQNPYFFSSRVIQSTPPVFIELDKIYRQSDRDFIELLNKIRHNKMTDEDIGNLNAFYKPGFKPPESEKYITLCSHHYKANAINERELRNLPGRLFQFEAQIEGEFNISASPAERTLFLKKGAQIMFVKNDTGESKRYFNGKIGIIQKIDEDEIVVAFPEEKDTLILEKEQWKNIRYSYDDTTRSISEKELGTFQQFPIRLAWAITIHKSQGLSFDRARIDAEDSFTSGQVYVALSRLRSLKGLVLETPIKKRSIVNDGLVLDHFRKQSAGELKEILESERMNYLKRMLLKSLDWGGYENTWIEFINEYQDKQVSHREDALYLGKKCLKKGRELKDIAGRFNRQVSMLFSEGSGRYALLAERMVAARDYFSKQLKDGILSPIEDQYRIMEKKPRMRKYLKTLLNLQQMVNQKIREIEEASLLAKGLAKGENLSGLIVTMNENRKKTILESEKKHKPEKQKKGDSRKISFDMYREGKSVREIAEERMLQPGTIESHLLHYIRSGELEVFSLISREKYKKLYSRLANKTINSVSEIKHKMGDRFSYTEIRAVMNHLAYQRNNAANTE